MIARRSLLKAIPALLCAPAIVRVASLMPVKGFAFETEQLYTLTWPEADGVIGYHVYGRSPGQEVCSEIRELSARYAALIAQRNNWYRSFDEVFV